MKQYILNSLSFGVKAIANGEIKKEEVKYFITGTAFPVDKTGMPNFNEIVEHYGNSYWADYRSEVEGFQEKCFEVVRYLIDNKKILQPRIILGNEQSPYATAANAPFIGHSHKSYFETAMEWAGMSTEAEASDASKHNMWLIERLRAHGYNI